MTAPERSSLNPPPESSRWGVGVAIVLALLLAGGGWWWWQQQQQAASVAVAPASAAPAQPSAVVPDEMPAGPQNPIEALAPPDAALPALNGADEYVARALEELLGNAKAASALQMDGFVRRVVASVDNLARDQAPARMWPVAPTAERFTVTGSASAGDEAIALDNAARYSGFVQRVESVDVQRAAAFYARLYPLFQQAYEGLGYPGRYFNDRLVAVIDHLLQAPEPQGPVRVTLTEVKGDMASTRPWVRYEFADPELQALSSGQKIMVRVGLVNERRLKQRLRAFRAAVATGAVAKAKP